jgi:hypothetical protein
MLALADRRSGALAAVCCSRSSASLLTASARSLRSRSRSALSLANSSSYGCSSQSLIFCSISSRTSRNLPIVVDLNTFIVGELCQRTTGSRRYALRSSSPTPRIPPMR